MKRSNFFEVTKKPGSGSSWICILLALPDPDLDLYIAKVLDPDPQIEYTDSQHCF